MSLPIVAVGFFGGSAPSLMKAASSLANGAELTSISWGYAIGLLIYGFIGGIMALALGEQNLRGALFAGIAAPALITNAITGAQDLRSTTERPPVVITQPGPSPVGPSSRWSLISNASAQTPSAPRGASTPTTPIVEQGSVNAEPGTIFVTVQFGPQTARAPVTLCVSPTTETERCRWRAVVTNSATVTNIPASPGDTIRVDGVPLAIGENTAGVRVSVTPAPSPLNDLRWALGGTREAPIGQISVSPVPALAVERGALR